MGRAVTKQFSRQLPSQAPQRDSDKSRTYSSLDQLNGSHPYRVSVPKGSISYKARKLNKGKVCYFNFSLAKEMGLIPKGHPHKMNKILEKKLLDTFSIQIINEYDLQQNIRFHPSVMCEGEYMATRYLQLQHQDKAGRTSGDGRCIWNGIVQHNGKTWDVSSRGTGVTQLAPGVVEAGKPIKTGSTKFGYGCGTADLDELVGCALMAETFHNNGIQTERVLAIIDLGKGLGIGVRAAPNLLRPAHMFMFLKQGDLESLEQSVNYFIDRQYKNGIWHFSNAHKRKYELMLEEITKSYAAFAAQLDREYVFAWLDWDGDNVLADAGIIDYGSIRQFGLRHDEYRYDDVDRYSTNLNEQRSKAKLIVQVFTQMMDYLITKTRKPLEHFSNSKSLQSFDKEFESQRLDYFLFQLGLSDKKREIAIDKFPKLTKKMFKAYSVLESHKTYAKARRVPDGMNRPAILNMRSILYDLPDYLLQTSHVNKPEALPVETFWSLVLADSATKRDSRLTQSIRNKIMTFQNSYIEFCRKLGGQNQLSQLLKNMRDRAKDINSPTRMTGDGVLYVVDKLLTFKKQNRTAGEFQVAIDRFIKEQSRSYRPAVAEARNSNELNSRVHRIVQTLLELIDGHKESI